MKYDRVSIERILHQAFIMAELQNKKLTIVDKKGEFLSVEKGIIRYFGYMISGVFLLIGYFWIYWDPNNQGWHDKFANSFVVIVND